MSYQSLYDQLNPNGDYNTFPFNDGLNNLHLSQKPLFNYYSKIRKPHSVILGANDEYCYNNVGGVVELMKEAQDKTTLAEYQIIPDANHGFDNKYDVLAKIVLKFLKK